jgi:hypothetical protein
MLKLNMKTHAATLAAQYARAKNFDVAFSGNTQLLPNGNVLVGWGSRSYFSEYSKSHQLLLDAVWPGPDLSYRALFTNSWVGTPFFPPRGAARSSHGRTTIYASWDGATQVVAWRVLAGPSGPHLRSVGSPSLRKTGFETTIRLNGSYKAYKVQALDASGRVLRTSSVFPAPKSQPPPSPGFY